MLKQLRKSPPMPYPASFRRGHGAVGVWNAAAAVGYMDAAPVSETYSEPWYSSLPSLILKYKSAYQPPV